MQAKRSDGSQTRGRPRARPRMVRPRGAGSAGSRLGFLLDRLGNNQTAEVIGVNRSQPSRWRSGEERISPENERRILDLDYVLARLLRLFAEEQALIWLRSHNAHLGARPIDVLKLRGVEQVVAAIDAEEQGAYA